MSRDTRTLAPERPTGNPDVARTDELEEAVAAILPALDAFNRFEGPERAGIRSEWLPALDEPLPESGAGLDAVIEILRDVVIPRGLRTGHPGFTSWVTTAPTTGASVAQLAAAVAAPQRWWHQPGNHIDVTAVRWCMDLLGFPESFVGTFTSGGSTANLVGLGAARQHAGERIGIDPSLAGWRACRGRASMPPRKCTTWSPGRWVCWGWAGATVAPCPWMPAGARTSVRWRR